MKPKKKKEFKPFEPEEQEQDNSEGSWEEDNHSEATDIGMGGFSGD